MSGLKYWTLVFLALIIAALNCSEILCENQVTGYTSSIAANQDQVALEQRKSELLQHLVQRIALVSQQDPALADLLAKRGFHISVTSPAGNPHAPPVDARSAPSPSAPPTPKAP